MKLCSKLILFFFLASASGFNAFSNVLTNKEQCKVLSCGTKDDLKLTPIDGKLFYFHTGGKMNWFAASDFCKQHGMHLANIQTKKLNEHIKEHIKSSIPEDAKAYGEHFFIGLHDNAKEGEFRWENTGEIAEYVDFGKGQPDNSYEHCVEILIYISEKILKFYAWNDLTCATQCKLYLSITRKYNNNIKLKKSL